MFAEMILSNNQTCKVLSQYEIITSVPISKKRKKERGYNQSELIAKEISKKLNIKYEKNVLYKVKNTVAQSKLNKRQREENARGVYEIRNKKEINKKKILLIDDIYTTGSTVNECSRVLQKIYPQKIGIFTIAKD